MVEIIKKLAKAKGMSINDVEKHIGVANNSMYKWDRIEPSAMKVVKVAELLDCTVEELVQAN